LSKEHILEGYHQMAQRRNYIYNKLEDFQYTYEERISSTIIPQYINLFDISAKKYHKYCSVKFKVP
jgi:hypothetical protein